MKKIVLGLLLITNFCFAQVVIPNKVGQFCAESIDRVYALEDINKDQRIELDSMRQIIKIDSVIFEKHKTDSSALTIKADKEKEIGENYFKEVEIVHGQVKQWKGTSIIEGIIIIGLIILSL